MTKAIAIEIQKPFDSSYVHSLKKVMEEVNENEGDGTSLSFSRNYYHSVKYDFYRKKINVNPFLILKEWVECSNLQDGELDINDSWRFKFFVAVLLKKAYDEVFATRIMQKDRLNQMELEDYFKSKYFEEELYRINIRNIKRIFKKKRQKHWECY